MAEFDLKLDWGDLREKLEGAAERARMAAKKELYLCAEEVMAASKEVCPMDTGALVNTGHVGRHQAPGVAEGFVYDDGDAICVDLGYGSESVGYALAVHENLQPGVRWTRPSSGPKFLENPFNAVKDAIPPRILEVLKKAILNP
jgi:hypothetical protein